MVSGGSPSVRVCSAPSDDLVSVLAANGTTVSRTMAGESERTLSSSVASASAAAARICLAATSLSFATWLVISANSFDRWSSVSCRNLASSSASVRSASARTRSISLCSVRSAAASATSRASRVAVFAADRPRGWPRSVAQPGPDPRRHGSASAHRPAVRRLLPVIEPGSPWENGYIESFNGKLRDELLDREIFYTLTEAKILIERWRRQYNTVRWAIDPQRPRRSCRHRLVV